MMERNSKRDLFIFGAAGIAFLLFAWGISAPGDFVPGTIVSIPEGSGLGQISRLLGRERIVRFPYAFQALAVLLGGERRMKAGEYYFGKPATAPIVAWRVSRGDHEIETAKVTVPEGFTVAQISDLFGKEFPFFDNASFEKVAPEGYLFPDTYFVPVTTNATSTIKLMHDNFVRRIFPLLPEIEKSGKSVEEIVTMASLLEAEAKTKADRERIADVLWKRLKLGMPLQVDSEMGTYEFQGLPEKPINNPGLVSISAAIHPTTTPYLYFLSDKSGSMHYAKTFDEHQANIAKYLR
ncbi:endolytic transglycosylase MltG [Candidatus Parcubacteria bacterium]|nr:endolytic transglycosylase MltG [Candidatus Parcubacteria bacterium]